MRLSELPIIDMTREDEFEKWWAHANENSSCEKRSAKWVWQCAWTTAKLGQLDRAEDEACVEIRANLMALAVQCFRDKEDDQAEFFRNLADERHIIWSK